MVQGLRVVFSPTPAALSRYGYRVPATGTRGTITAARVGAGIRTYLDGRQETLVVDLNDVLKRGRKEKDIALTANDVVVVPESFV